jgi:hypothetical protein
MAAPYLMHLEYGDRRSRHFLEQAWGNSWGIFLKCDERLQTLRRHLRGFLKVRDSNGNKLLFRYYDPRVLRLYLPSCFSDELRIFFGPIERIWTEGETAETMLEFGFDGARLVRNELPIDSIAKEPVPAIETRLAPAQQRYSPEMLTIRAAQLAVFSHSEVRKFENWMVAHLSKFFPRQCASLGELKVRETVQYGIQRAACYGLTSKRDVCKYIDIMLVLGPDFDTNQRHAWAGEILSWRTDPAAKMQTLISAASFRV